MRVTVKRVVYPDPRKGQESPNGFTVIKYICNDHKEDDPLAVDEEGNDLYHKEFSANGTFLPSVESLKYEIKGQWVKDKYGRTLKVTEFTEEIPQDEDGIKAYLSSGMIKGIGPKQAKKIYETFGNDTFSILDDTPERLLEVKGIKEKNLEKIITSYVAHRSAREIVKVLSPLGVSTNKIVKIYNKFKDTAYETVTQHPYQLCGNGIGFKTADLIAKGQHLPLNSVERVAAALYNVLEQAEMGGYCFSQSSGNLCISYSDWIEKTSNFLEARRMGISEDIMSQGAMLLAKEGKVKALNHPKTKIPYVYRSVTMEAEAQTAEAIMGLLAGTKKPKYDIADEIRKQELEHNFPLAPEQNAAVISGLSNYLSVITGGPGTGKTTIINFIRKIYVKNKPNAKILLCAPTGMAAHRMSESTGYSACTIHKALNLCANDEGQYDDVDEISYDLIIIDEISMLDIFLAKVLFRAIKKGTQVVLIGDANQLPSVGPGALLADMIGSGVIPVVKLTKVYRQAGNSKIALNSMLMQRGNAQFDYDETFQFIPAYGFDDAAEKMKNIYLREIAEVGVDNVTMLSPFRTKTATGVEPMNAMIRDYVNPPAEGKGEMKAFGKVFRQGDKVMQTKNVEEISNGDIGYITNINMQGIVTIDFGDNRIVEYMQADMENITWAYATTVHKSQGSEYKVVVFNLLEEHQVMLKRNLLYTAVTRAKTKVYIVGSKKAINIAVNSDKTDFRMTMLKERLQFLARKLKLVA